MQDASFNLYTYVNEVDAEVESLEDSITRMQGEINEYTEHVSAEHVSAGASASSVHAKLQEAQARAAAHESRLQSALQVVEQLQAGISSLFEAAVSARAGGRGGGGMSCVSQGRVRMSCAGKAGRP
jgi:chromosome segregation ATPase